MGEFICVRKMAGLTFNFSRQETEITTGPNAPVRGGGSVHVVDDDILIGELRAEVLRKAGFAPVLYDSGESLLEAMPAHPTAGCLLLNVKLPGIGGLELQRLLPERNIGLPVVMTTSGSDVGTAVQAMRAGAVDFIEKPVDDQRLFQALDMALAVATSRSWDCEIADAAVRVAKLSPRELAVLDGLVAGQANKIIAAGLGISVRTVEMHRARMLERLDVAGLGEAVRLAVMAALAASDGDAPQPRHSAADA
jgi:two-component system response regulator FixJ